MSSHVDFILNAVTLDHAVSGDIARLTTEAQEALPQSSVDTLEMQHRFIVLGSKYMPVPSSQSYCRRRAVIVVELLLPSLSLPIITELTIILPIVYRCRATVVLPIVVELLSSQSCFEICCLPSGKSAGSPGA